jgi:glycosyltransferase involved in cell wall biosynthesis
MLTLAMNATTQSPLGVSVAICCHNSAGRLPQTLAHLQAQRVHKQIRWEVLLVDNASVDNTSRVARECWPDDTPTRLRIVFEPQIGLSNARMRAFSEANYELIGFVDDDNWVNTNWVQTVCQIMSADPEIGAVGGVNEAVADVAFPSWFDSYSLYYAVLHEHEFAALGNPPKRLAGAGLTIRKIAWDGLLQQGFHSWLAGRTGKRLSAGEDTELTMALEQSGWKLALDPRLKLKHFMPANRLDWRYLRKMARAHAASHVALEPYHANGNGDRAGRPFDKSWLWHLLGTTKALMVNPRMIRALLSSDEGDRSTIEAEEMLGRIIGLAVIRGRYRQIAEDVRNARWRLKNAA